MGIMDNTAIKGFEKAATALKPFLESIHARLELQNVQLARIEVLLDDKKHKGSIAEDAKKLLAELEANFK